MLRRPAITTFLGCPLETVRIGDTMNNSGILTVIVDHAAPEVKAGVIRAHDTAKDTIMVAPDKFHHRPAKMIHPFARHQHRVCPTWVTAIINRDITLLGILRVDTLAPFQPIHGDVATLWCRPAKTLYCRRDIGSAPRRRCRVQTGTRLDKLFQLRGE